MSKVNIGETTSTHRKTTVQDWGYRQTWNRQQDVPGRSVLYCGFWKSGTSILVFLPGMLEIVTLYDSLHDMLQDQGITCVDIFVQHSQLPLEEQAIALVAPSLDRVHVILSTNLSESSVTIPSLALVINTALQQYSHFDSTQQMSVLRKTWTSKAACTQRAGRAGREFPGVVIHTIPRTLYNLLPDFNTPEMSTAPLDRLYLSARSIGPHPSLHQAHLFKPNWKTLFSTLLNVVLLLACQVKSHLKGLSSHCLGS